MRIEGHSIVTTLESYLSRVSESRSYSVSNNAGLTAGGAEDPIELSAEAVEFNRIKSFISAIPEIRQKKVNQLADEVKNGRYYVTPELIGPGLVREHIMDALLTT